MATTRKAPGKGRRLGEGGKIARQDVQAARACVKRLASEERVPGLIESSGSGR